MNRFHIIGRLAVIVSGLGGILLGLSAGPVPAAVAGMMVPLGGDPHGRPGLASPRPGWDKHPPLPGHAQAMATGGMPGWQIALIAVVVALLAAALAVGYRIRAARRRVAASAT